MEPRFRSTATPNDGRLDCYHCCGGKPGSEATGAPEYELSVFDWIWVSSFWTLVYGGSKTVGLYRWFDKSIIWS